MQRHYTIPTIGQHPRGESNLALDLRTVACRRHTPRMFITDQYPGQESNLGLLLRTEP